MAASGKGRKRTSRRGGTAPHGDTPQIFVADLAAYNNGKLHGAWIDATQDPDDIAAEIKKILDSSPVEGAEEWAIHDYEGFGKLRLGEFEKLETVSTVARLIEEHGEVIAGLVDHLGGLENVDDAESAFEESYQGSYNSLADWAEDFAKDTGASMENYRNYVAWDDVGRDAEMSGDIFTVETDDGRVHVFWSR